VTSGAVTTIVISEPLLTETGIDAPGRITAPLMVSPPPRRLA
jgi:hypothetical protein